MKILQYLLGCGLGYLSGVAVLAISVAAKSKPESVGNWIIWLLLLMVASTGNLIWFLSS